MTSLQGDIVNRVKRLPKPSLAAEALQPLFEAVSNSLHAIEDAFGDALYQSKGLISVSIRNLRSPGEIEIIVDDNGIGLEPPRFKAFCTTSYARKLVTA
jgi:DNA topoisomerase VI subunit B